MDADTAPPPPFYCPACGRKHRADLGALRARDHAAARLTCVRCQALLSLRLGTDGLPRCEVLTPSPTDVPAPAPRAPRTAGDAMKKVPLPLTLIASAVVAAVVGFAAAGARQPATAPPPDEAARITVLEATAARLTTRLDAQARQVQAALQQAQAAEARVTAMRTWAEGGLRTNAATVRGLESARGAITKDVERLRAEYRALQGRIEGNYVNLRGLTKRLKALEGR